MEKNQEFIVTIEDMNEDGAGVGKVDGYIWFVKDAVIGDVVRAKAMKITRLLAISVWTTPIASRWRVCWG